MSKNTTRLLALVTLEHGTPLKPAAIAPGQVFEWPSAEAKALVDRGFAKVAPADAVVPASPASPVEIPAGWQDLSAAELVELARNLGAGDDVKTKAAAEFVGKVEADRKQAQLV